MTDLSDHDADPGDHDAPIPVITMLRRMHPMAADARENAFQQDIINQMIAGGWKLGDPAKYNRELALYESDCLDFVKRTQPKTWEKYQGLYPASPEKAFVAKLAAQLDKSDPSASDKSLRSFGAYGYLYVNLPPAQRAGSVGLYNWFNRTTKYDNVRVVLNSP
jgi:hypothetical protein